MGLSIEQVAYEALALPASQRADLAHRLIQSLDEGFDKDAEEKWKAEIERRVGEVTRGEVEGIPVEQVLSELRNDLTYRLITSVDEGIDEGVEETWKQEIQRRLEDIDSGNVKLIPADEVFQKLEARNPKRTNFL